jgi:hypothetical protein
MFILVTVATLVTVAKFKLFDFGRPLHASDPASFAAFGSFTWQAWIIYIVWLITLIGSFVPVEDRLTLLRYISRFGANSNMQVLQSVLLASSLLLAIWGWVTGNTFLFIPGVITLLGLLGNAIEQRSLIR